MRPYRLILAALASLLLAALAAGQMPSGAPATQPTSRPTRAIPLTGCVTDKCHAEVKNYKVLHGPVNVNACDACHKLTDAARHKFELARNKTLICTFCHKMETHGDPVVHKPVRDGDCLPCHNPHGAVNKSFLRGATMNDLCKNCHKDVMTGKKFKHGPAAAGACGACHRPHTSKLPKLLVAQGNELCFGCHSEMKVQLKKVRFVHKAVQGDCTKCHDPHASNYTKQTTQPAVQLCTACHQDVKNATTVAKHKHSIVTQGDACLNCHTPHGGDLARLMKNEQIKVCLTCHDKKVERPDGEEVQSVAEVLDPKLVKHGPIKDGGCGNCHAVHGGDVARLLAKPYPETFYEAFDVKKYDLCFSCHDKQLVLLKETRNLTNFRNGDENLHYLHVNKAKGRSCRACHNTHASKNPLHIRESVPFGNWQLPVRYTPTANGGKCAAGCHQELAYDRVNPVVRKTTEEGPATMPAAGTQPAATTQPANPVVTPPPASAPSPTTSAPASLPAGPASPKNKESHK